MRKIENPGWNDWTRQVVTWCEQVVKFCKLSGYNMDGTQTHKLIKVGAYGSTTDFIHPFPYILVGVTGRDRGINSENEGQYAQDSTVYTNIGTGSYIGKQVEQLERLYIGIAVYSNVYSDLIEITDLLHRFFLSDCKLFYTWQGEERSVQASFQNIDFTLQEANKEGLKEYFRSIIELQLQVATNSITQDQIVSGIEQVETSIEKQLNDESATIVTKVSV